MRSGGKPEIAMPRSSSWMPYAPQGVKGHDDDDIHVYRKQLFFGIITT